jgi:hypothetical protein
VKYFLQGRLGALVIYKRLTMSRAKSAWFPPAGMLVTYRGRTRQSIRNVRVVAEASAGRMVVEAIGKQGVPVRLTVKRDNLLPMEPDLFD